MGLIEILLLAVIQGVTEFLPVSSSGHLVIGAALLEAAGGQPPADLLAVNIFLHLGTLLAILVFFARRVARLLGADRRVIGLLIVGTLPAVCVGLPLKKLAPGVLESPLLAGLMLPCTGGLLIWASRIEPGSLEYPKMGYRAALLTGLFQAVAILPGISRSGSTIAAGLAAGLERENAATFAFLLAIPAIAGAGVLELAELAGSGQTGTPIGHLLLGMTVSFVVGILSLAWLIRWVATGRLVYFAYWCIPLGVATTIWQLWP